MYRERIRPCPGCEAPMGEVALVLEDRRITVDVCRRCGGAFLKYDDGEPAALAHELYASMGASMGPSLAHGTGREVAFGREPVCPECDCALVVLAYMEDGPPLYRCSRCMAVFATSAQLGRLAEYRQTDAAEPFWRALWRKLPWRR